LIYHADLAKLPAILAHPVAMIPPDFRILLVTPIGFLSLLLPTLVPAFLTAVRLSPIARATNKKHHPAIRCPAKQLSKRNFALHRPTGAEWTTAAARGKLGFTVLWPGSSRSHHKQNPDRFSGRGFAFLRSGSYPTRASASLRR